MKPHRQEFVLLSILIGVLLLCAEAGVLLRWEAHRDCGAPIPGTPLWGGIGSVLMQSTTWITPAASCHPPVTALDAGMLMSVLILLAVIVTVAVLWRNWTQSMTYFRRELLLRPGFAERREVRVNLGEAITRRRAKVLRPDVARPTASDAGWPVGKARRLTVWLSTEMSVVIWGPPRSGKTFRIIIGAILSAVGAVVTTSTRPENLKATYKFMLALGRPVVIFDPQGLTGLPAVRKWSPIIGADNPRVATRRARDIMAASGAADGNNADWAASSGIIVSRLLHAAALGGRNIETLRQWTASPSSARTAISDLETVGAAPGWGESLRATLEGDPKLLDSNWHLLKLAFEPLFQPDIAAAMSPVRGEEFDPREFIDGRGILYLVGTGSAAGAVGGFLSAMMNDVVEAAREKAMTQKGGRLDPPLTLILDEIANMFAWPELPIVLADGGGQGITALVVLQALSQARSSWSDAQAATIWSSAIVKILLGGAADYPDLDNFSKLLGNRIVKQESTSMGTWGPSISTTDHEVPLIRPDELRRLPDGLGILASKNLRGVLLDMTGWTDRKDARAIMAGAAAADEEALVGLVAKYATPMSVMPEPVRPVAGQANV
ncbi:MAG TPA: type IV secretory system conjugative DNA transfer family protein [Galbitalea sp.]